MEKGLLPPARAQMLRGWMHSGFNVYRSRRVGPEERADLERLAQYIIRNPFSVEKMQVTEANRANPDGSIIYHSGMNPKIQRNFEVFTPCEFIAAIAVAPGHVIGGSAEADGSFIEIVAMQILFGFLKIGLIVLAFNEL